MKIFKKINLFTFLIIVTAVSFAFRLDNFSNDLKQNTLTKTAIAKEDKADIKNSEEKPPSYSDLNKQTDQIASDGGNFGNDNKANNQSQKNRRLPLFEGNTFTKEEMVILQSLSKRRKQIDEREDEIAKKEALLQVTSNEVDKKIAELTSMRQELENLLGKQKDMQEDRLEQIVKIYQSMKPKDAANILNTLEMPVLLQLMGRMSERKSAPILAVMDAEVARQLTIELSKQRKLPEIP